MARARLGGVDLLFRRLEALGARGARLGDSAGGGRGSGIRRGEVAAYAMGIVSLVVALVSPLDYLSDIVFFAHMAQHEILMLVAAPLVVLGRPMIALLWALGPALRQKVGAAVQRA